MLGDREQREKSRAGEAVSGVAVAGTGESRCGDEFVAWAERDGVGVQGGEYDDPNAFVRSISGAPKEARATPPPHPSSQSTNAHTPALHPRTAHRPTLPGTLIFLLPTPTALNSVLHGPSP